VTTTVAYIVACLFLSALALGLVAIVACAYVVYQAREQRRRH
jgi:hypothetical protein